MNKQELVELLAKRTQLSKKEARSALDTTLDLIVEGAKKEGKVTLTGFGSFEVVQRKAARRFNPRTRQPIQVPARKVPKFRAGKQFKQAVAR